MNFEKAHIENEGKQKTFSIGGIIAEVINLSQNVFKVLKNTF